MKDLIYATPVESEEDLIARIVDVSHRVRETPEVLKSASQCYVVVSFAWMWEAVTLSTYCNYTKNK